MITPVKRVKELTEALANGDLTKTITYQGKDEVAVLTESVNTAIVTLRGLVSQVAQISEQVASSSEELSVSAQEVGQVTQQVSDTIDQLAAGADEQARSAQETSGIVERMGVSIEQVDSLAGAMVVNANSATEKGEQGQEAVDKAIYQMNEIKNKVNQSAQAITELGVISQQVGQIVEVITGIADQTNLLALNAAIEAARAGEQGRGFAVVAEEVRKLAEQSRQAAEEISTLISQIQIGTERAVEAMQVGTQEVEVGTDVMLGTREAFQAIVQAIKVTVDQIQNVSLATKGLAQNSTEVMQAVESIAAITEEAAAGTEEIAASSEEQTASVEEIAQATEVLAGMAQDLQKAIGRFKLN